MGHCAEQLPQQDRVAAILPHINSSSPPQFLKWPTTAVLKWLTTAVRRLSGSPGRNGAPGFGPAGTGIAE